MTKSGKTTRTIDNAVQAFFSNGEGLYVPTYHQLIDREDGSDKAEPIPEDLSEDQIIIDPDWKVSSTVQRHLLGAILKRLNFEHQGMARKYKIRGQYITKLSDEEAE